MATESEALRIDKIVREPERRDLTGICRTSAWLLEQRGEFPARVTLSPGAVGWRLSELLRWISERQAGGAPAHEAAMKAAETARRRLRRR